MPNHLVLGLLIRHFFLYTCCKYVAASEQDDDDWVSRVQGREWRNTEMDGTCFRLPRLGKALKSHSETRRAGQLGEQNRQRSPQRRQRGRLYRCNEGLGDAWTKRQLMRLLLWRQVFSNASARLVAMAVDGSHL
ncbi:hypothetical protein LZ32DRAFT_185092 [Colletotrichum eremochloae]|nr:hypothetical protein LZ32DRAFT_185092 [Colletotrichum eremochloae]